MIADKFGRKLSLIISVLLMAIPTSCIGLLPTYESVGIAAPIILTIIRLIQGLALGGGFSACIAFTIEHAPKDKKGFAGSASLVGMGMGILAGVGITYVLTEIIGQENFNSWGWRIPFIASILIALISLYMRNNVTESPEYLRAKESGILSKSPIHDLFKNNLLELASAIFIYCTVAVPFNTFMFFMKQLMIQTYHFSNKEAMKMSTISIIVHTLLIPVAAFLSDKIGRKKILFISCLMFIVCNFSIFRLFEHGFAAALTGQIIFGAILAFYIAPIPAVLLEIFPTSVRFSGVALSYNISAALFGGTAPTVLTWLVFKNSNINGAVSYIILFNIISLIALLPYKDKYKEVWS